MNKLFWKKEKIFEVYKTVEVAQYDIKMFTFS